MRNLIVSMNITANGFISGPGGELDWHFKYWNNEMCECICEQLQSADTLLFGKNTYTALARYWSNKSIEPGMPRGDIILANIMNRYQKIVSSQTLNLLPWANSFLLKGGLSQGINKFKNTEGKNIITYGSGKLVTSLIQGSLVDRFELWVHPVKLKKGLSLFKTPGIPHGMVLSHKKLLRSGVENIRYDRV